MEKDFTLAVIEIDSLNKFNGGVLKMSERNYIPRKIEYMGKTWRYNDNLKAYISETGGATLLASEYIHKMIRETRRYETKELGGVIMSVEDNNLV